MDAVPIVHVYMHPI